TPALGLVRRPLPFVGPVVLPAPPGTGFGWPARARVTDGAVTEYPAPTVEGVRRASPADAVAIHGLLDGYARQGLLLPRTLEQVEESIADFLVAENEAGLIACGALRFHSAQLAEVAALAVV